MALTSEQRVSGPRPFTVLPRQGHKLAPASERDTYWVKERLGVWIVRHDDVEIASLPGRTHAVAVAVQRAQANPPSEILILGRDGAIEERREFGDEPDHASLSFEATSPAA
jgi:hypothetical protein